MRNWELTVCMCVCVCCTSVFLVVSLIDLSWGVDKILLSIQKIGFKFLYYTLVKCILVESTICRLFDKKVDKKLFCIVVQRSCISCERVYASDVRLVPFKLSLMRSSKSPEKLWKENLKRETKRSVCLFPLLCVIQFTNCAATTRGLFNTTFLHSFLVNSFRSPRYVYGVVAFFLSLYYVDANSSKIQLQQ